MSSIATHARHAAVVVFALGTCALGATFAQHARADVLPINACTSPGQPCGADGKCTCGVATCTRVLPCGSCAEGADCTPRGGRPADDEDAGHYLCDMKYSCKLCTSRSGAACPTHGGSGGAGGKGGTGGTKPDSGSESAGEGDNGCSCSAATDDVTGGTLVALATLWFVRRRRSGPRSHGG